MLFIHEGNPGSGKSYDVQVRIQDQLKAGRVVYSNVDGHDDVNCRQAIAEMTGIAVADLRDKLVFLSDADVSRFWEVCKPGSFIVIDEIHKFFNSREWSSDVNKSFSSWCSTHRHEGFDLCMITQRASKIDSQARSMCEWRYFYRRINFFGSMFKKGYLIYCYASDDVKAMSVKRAEYDVRYFRCYHSYKGNVLEKTVVKNVNLFKHPAFYALGFCVCLFAYFFSQSSFAQGDILMLNHSSEKLSSALASGVVPSLGAAEAPQKSTGQPPPAGSGGGPVVVAEVSPAPAVPAVVWLPVSGYLATESGQKFVYVGNYRLSTWVQLTEDKRLVAVFPSGLPPQILALATAG